MIHFLQKRKRLLSWFFIGIFIFQFMGATAAYGLTSGPSQPEVQAFRPAGASDMVDLFSGDFSYNIPLFELPGPNGGYPFNLAYSSGVMMDQEASWVGLGWSMQPGAITRQMRGLPDEFRGDLVQTTMAIDPSVTVGLGAGAAVELFGGSGEVGMGFSVYQNSYKGMGYSIDATLSFEKTVKGATGGLSLGLSLDSQEGVGVNPSLSLGGEMGQFGLGAGYNSKQGFTNVSLTASVTNGGSTYFNKSKDEKFSERGHSLGGATVSSTISMAHPGYTPQITMPMRSFNMSLTLKAGASWWGVFGAPYVTGFYNEQRLDKDARNTSTAAYGYLNYQHASSQDLLDYNREKDGMVTPRTPNLGIPSLSYDIYSVTGQGIGMMYRPMRNDYGIIYDQETSSVSNSIGLGVDVAPAASHVGVNLTVNHAKSTTGKWSENNEMIGRASFISKETNKIFEPWYFKVHGETTSENADVLKSIGGDKAVRVKIEDHSNTRAIARLENNSNSWTAPVNTELVNSVDRKPRSQSIIPITNGELLAGGVSSEVLPHFKVRYINSAGTEVPFDRSGLETHHFAGYTALTGDGLRYVYGIPSYNLKQIESTFSVAGAVDNNGLITPGIDQGNLDHTVTNTDNFLKKVELPPYAHSYLLSSILGPDYVDVLNDGITPDDLGYWVKFTYKKTTTALAPYKWRDPFIKAHYEEGWKTDPRDNKGRFTYGEKELWYLARAETKSHIATFSIDARQDGRGVSKFLQDATDPLGGSVYSLTAITLFTRLSEDEFKANGTPIVPIKITRFSYDNSLCNGVFNSGTANGGKLTLKKVWFEYGKTDRGKFNPYEFKYNNDGVVSPLINYSYTAYDRWGNYKPYPTNQPLYNTDCPYVDQNPTLKPAIDQNSAAWSLKEITLPSGGKIVVDYESDDYAYVQSKTAMQMIPIVNPYPTLPGGTLTNIFSLDQSNYKIRFKLEKPVPATLSVQEQTAEVKKYLDAETKQLFFKTLVNLRSPGEDFYEYVQGYAEIDFSRESDMKLEKEQTSSTEFTYGSFYLSPERGNGRNLHPLSMRAYQHLRTNQPDLTNSGRKLEATTSEAGRVNQIKGLGGIAAHIKKMFEGFYNYCEGKNWGKQINAEKTWIRLNSPDKIKYGGGLRVKQITLKDNWAGDEEGVYGQRYDYTTTEGTQIISSGVASYEPVVGGEENALRHAKKYVQSVPMRSDNSLFFEYPANEMYYPGPQVGYSKVTVMSLPSAALAGQPLQNLPTGVFPSGTSITYGTSGKTIHEFYTAKDFPVITDETEKINKHYRLAVPVPLLGSITVNKLSASQGYSIITNDMHGKPRKVSTYRQSKDGSFENEPMTWVKYNYVSRNRVYNEKKVSELVNTFKDNRDGTLSVQNSSDLTDNSLVRCHIGQEVEFFHDMRQSDDNAWTGGARYNTDMVWIPVLFAIIPIPVPSVWPNVSSSKSQLRISSTNKVIFRTGILESIEAYDGGSVVKTLNRKWDKVTGSVVLKSVNNNYDAPVFTFTIPAYQEYQGMGAAYQNIGLTFLMSNIQKDLYRNDLYHFTFPVEIDESMMQPGDEILLYPTANNFQTPTTRIVYVGAIEGMETLYTEVPLPATQYHALIVRSGFRNQLTVSAGSISALKDPSVPGAPVTYTKTISVPK
jgi:hypothetical protein